MKKIIAVFLVIFVYITASAQQVAVDRSLELKIGDRLPLLPKMPIINYSDNFFNYDKQDDRLIILDLFNTGCTSCIAKMPALQKLKKEFGRKLEVIMVTPEDKGKMEGFYRNNKFLKEHAAALPTIVSDTLLQKYFPHVAVSHVAWIYKNQVMAISHPDYVTAENIQKILKGESIDIPQKDDFSIVEITSDDQVSVVDQEKMIGSVQITGFNPKLNSTGIKFVHDSTQGVHTTYFNNLDLLGAFTAAWSRIKKPTYLLLKERIEWNVKNPDRYHYDELKGLPYQMWQEKYSVSYKRMDHLDISDSLRAKKVLDDLSDFFGVKVSWELRKRRCLVITKAEQKHTEIKQKGLRYDGTESLAFAIDYSGKYPPVIDEVKLIVDMEIPDFKNLDELSLYLANYGAIVKEDWRDIEVLVFKEN